MKMDKKYFHPDIIAAKNSTLDVNDNENIENISKAFSSPLFPTTFHSKQWSNLVSVFREFLMTI